MISIKTKLIHPDAKLPTRAHTTDAGFDLYCAEAKWDAKYKQHVCNSGIAVEIPEGHVGLLFPRSSIYRTHLHLSNAVGVIDSGYRGEVTARFRVDPNTIGKDGERKPHRLYQRGERFAQLIILPIPALEFIEVEELNDNTDRGANGYGSSGK